MSFFPSGLSAAQADAAGETLGVGHRFGYASLGVDGTFYPADAAAGYVELARGDAAAATVDLIEELTAVSFQQSAKN